MIILRLQQENQSDKWCLHFVHCYTATVQISKNVILIS